MVLKSAALGASVGIVPTSRKGGQKWGTRLRALAALGLYLYVPRHITATIDSASSLIRDEAWPVVTPTDAGALVLAILLHDSAMHLSEDGFVSLVGPKPANRQVTDWAEMPWPNLWRDFLGEASRFDARKLNSLFGGWPIQA